MNTALKLWLLLSSRAPNGIQMIIHRKSIVKSIVQGGIMFRYKRATKPPGWILLLHLALIYLLLASSSSQFLIPGALKQPSEVESRYSCSLSLRLYLPACPLLSLMSLPK